MLLNYTSKKQLKEAVGERLSYVETSIFGDEYKSTGSFVGARRPHLQGGGHEFFAKIIMKDDIIVKVV
jgi:hypothetical protein|tara:strand:+ start:9186 stop:9389 length:204 start_codon:yes stop_codon:yes gene_type:complete